MKRFFKGLAVVTILAAAVVVMLIGCSNKDVIEKQNKYKEEGIAYLENGEYDKAIKSFQLALDQKVGSITERELDICFYKARAQYLSGDYDGALETYTGVINYKESADAYYLRGNLYFSMGSDADALADYEKAVANDPDNYELYIGIHESLAAHSMNDRAVEYLQTALSIDGKKADDYMYKGYISYLLGDNETAISYLTTAIEKKSVKANFYLAEVYNVMGMEDEASTCLQSYLDSGVEDGNALMRLGEIQMNKGNYSQALSYFTLALEMDDISNKQILMKNTIAAYEKTGDFESAKTLMEEYVKEYPEDDDAQREYEFLETR